MCGICGYTGSDSSSLPLMLQYIRRRGPDHEGQFSKNNVHIAATRLSIRDVKNGNQPFFHKEINYVTVFNGEIYNYEFLKNKLEEKNFFLKTKCDTELLAPGLKFYGKEFISWIEGMFVFVVYDLSTGKITISRDRFGIKPLYYSKIKNDLYFSSSAKSIYNLDFFKKKINIKNLQSALSKRYVENFSHLFLNIEQLRPGEILEFEKNKLEKSSFLKDIKYENMLNKNQLHEKTKNFFENDINNFILSDVPMGIMMSSGIDSNLINEKLGDKLDEIFTIDFGTSKYNESKSLIKSNIFENQKTNLCTFNSYSFEKIFEETIDAFDNPILDSVIFPTNYLMKEVSKKVKVAFSGEGADEIFGGYYHFSLLNYIKIIQKLSIGPLLKMIIYLSPHNFLNLFFKYQGNLGKEGKKRLKFCLSSNFRSNEDFNDLISVFSRNELKNLLKKNYAENLDNQFSDFSKEKIYFENFNNWLPNYTLYKTDQLSMYNGLEVRVPYLNNNFYNLHKQIINYEDASLFKDKKILVDFIKANTKVKMKKKIALQNYLNKENRKFFINLLDKKININSPVFDLIEYNNFTMINSRYQSSPELILEKQLSSILILNAWLEKNA
tara:strand:+ start:6191 stop:8017 length:1827 start_codon:yes stop_codon:yes gene_type:complete